MPRDWSLINKPAGFSIVEVLLAGTVFGFLVVALMGALVYGRQSTAGAGDRVRAVMLAEEGAEAVRSIRDGGFAELADGTYGLVQSGGEWVLAGASDTTGSYTRRVTIASSDVARKTVGVTVSWIHGTVSREVRVETQLTNWRPFTP